MNKRRWLKFLEDRDFELNYHPCKANVLTDALSGKILHMLAPMARETELIEEFRDLSLIRRVTPNSVMLGADKVTNSVLGEIKEGLAGECAMWELEGQMKESYLELFSSGNFRGRKFFKWGRIVTPQLLEHLVIYNLTSF
jgi:hypothetical protein